jgi:hypothetical protein
MTLAVLKSNFSHSPSAHPFGIQIFDVALFPSFSWKKFTGAFIGLLAPDWVIVGMPLVRLPEPPGFE